MRDKTNVRRGNVIVPFYSARRVDESNHITLEMFVQPRVSIPGHSCARAPVKEALVIKSGRPGACIWDLSDIIEQLGACLASFKSSCSYAL